MSSLDYLVDAKPDWVEILSRKKRLLKTKMRSQKDSGAPGEVYFVSIENIDADCVKAYETPANRRLPECCVERHINRGSSFCLYLNSTRPIASIPNATAWWVALGKYLSHQDFASKHGRWPRDQGLSHGDAADIQIEMEELAEPLGWKTEVLDSIFRGRGFLAEAPLRQYKDKKKGFVNLRSPCPRGCRKLHFPYQKLSCAKNHCVSDCRKLHKPILRASCPNRRVIEELNWLEIKRKTEEEKLISDLREKGVQCCGTMKDCPLAT